VVVSSHAAAVATGRERVSPAIQAAVLRTCSALRRWREVSAECLEVLRDIKKET